VSTRPGLNSQSVLTTGYNAGILYGIARTLRRPTLIITPQLWTAHVGLPKGADKDMHRGLAQALFPVYSHLFARKKDDGRADAALIAHYGATHHRRAAA
jgi:crossover junction endodeoxyribonuclease RuvC